MTVVRRLRARVPNLFAAVGIGALALTLYPGPMVADDPLARAVAEQRLLAAERPGDPRIQNDLGNLLALTGDLDGAADAYQRALALDGENATAHYNYGRLLAGRRQRFAARRQFKRALEIDPSHAAAHYHLAALYDDWGFHRAAGRWYVRAFALDPTLADPARNPHIVGNRRALAAQLRLWQRERVPGPTREYEQPQRIVERVLPEIAPAAPAGRTPEPAPEPTAEPAPESVGGVVRSIDAPPRPPGQGEPGRAVGAPEKGSRDESEPTRTTEPAEPTGTRVLNAGSLVGSSVNQVVAPGGGRRPAPPGAGGDPGRFQPPRTRPFRPGVESTGRIELELQPAAAERWAIAG